MKSGMTKKAATSKLESTPDSAIWGRIQHLRLVRGGPFRIFAVGSEAVATVCFLRGRRVVIAGPMGDLRDATNYRRYVRAMTELEDRLTFMPDAVAHDLHPLYISTRYAQSLGVPCVPVQHHHAHAVSVMAEWGVEKRVVAICCDGVGYGPDGAAWGGEILSCDTASFERRGHIQYFPLIGGDAAAIETWRPAAALMIQAFGEDWRRSAPSMFERTPSRLMPMIDRLAAMHLNAPLTSSCGRLFDGVAFLLGLCDRNARPAQAAIALESAAADRDFEPYPYSTTFCNGVIEMSPAPMIRGLVRDLGQSRPVEELSARFHETLARMLAASALMVCDAEGLSTVVLAGGCFVNRRLRMRVAERLMSRHLRVLMPRRLPYGDAGLALGQAVAAAAMQERTQRCV